MVLLFGLSVRDAQRAGEYLSWTSEWTNERVNESISRNIFNVTRTGNGFNKIMRTGNGYNKVIIYILPLRKKGKCCFKQLEHACVWLKLDVCSICVRFRTQPRPKWLNQVKYFTLKAWQIYSLPIKYCFLVFESRIPSSSSSSSSVTSPSSTTRLDSAER